MLAAKKLMLMVSSSRARLLVFVLPPDLMQCQQAWPVFELPRIMMAEPFIFAPGVGTTCICYPLYRHRFQIVNAIDSLQSLRNLPFHKMQSGAAAMIRQIGNILDIVFAICSRSNRALGCVRQHRVHALAMPLGMWRRIRLLTA